MIVIQLYTPLDEVRRRARGRVCFHHLAYPFRNGFCDVMCHVHTVGVSAIALLQVCRPDNLSTSILQFRCKRDFGSTHEIAEWAGGSAQRLIPLPETNQGYAKREGSASG